MGHASGEEPPLREECGAGGGMGDGMGDYTMTHTHTHNTAGGTAHPPPPQRGSLEGFELPSRVS